MDIQPTEKTSYTQVIVTAAIILLFVAVLGGGAYIWKKKSQAQVVELQNEINALSSSEAQLKDSVQKEQAEKGDLEKQVDDLQAQSAELSGNTSPAASPSDGAPNCFTSGGISVAATPDGTWDYNRNFNTGFQYQIEGATTLSRDVAREEDGIDVFTITTKAYPAGALLKAYDIRKRRYALATEWGTLLSYEATGNVWYGAADGRAPVLCKANTFATTVGKLPVYLIASGSGSRTYLVLAKVNAAKADAPAFLLEFSLNVNDPALPADFVKNLEGLIKSVDVIGGQYYL
jgi:hypothetical protein